MTNEEQQALENYLKELEKHLAPLSVTDRSDILLELNTHIRESVENSKRSLEEIVRSLGTPQQVAQRYIEDVQDTQPQQNIAKPNSQPNAKLKNSKMKVALLIGCSFFFITIFYSWYKMTYVRTGVKTFIGGKNGSLVSVDKKNGKVNVLDGFVQVDKKAGKVQVGNLVNVDKKNGKVELFNGLIQVDKEKDEVKINGETVDHSNNISFNKTFEPVVGSGVLKTQELHISDFSKIEVATAIDANIKVGEKTSLKLTGDDNLLELIETTVNNNTLTIKVKPNASLRQKLKMTAEITTPQLNAAATKSSGNMKITNVNEQMLELTTQGSGDIHVQGKANQVQIEIQGSGEIFANELLANVIDINTKGSGDVKANVDGTLSVNVQSSSNVFVTGKADALFVKINGSGDVDTKDVVSQHAEIEVYGSGNAKVSPVQFLNAETFGSGEIIYYTAPTKVETKRKGSGRILNNS